LAHPDEPTRALTPERPAPVPAPAADLVRQTLRVALGLFALSLVVCLLVYAAITTPGPWFPRTEAKQWSAQQMSVSRGRGEMQDSALLLSPSDSSNTIVVALPTSFRSSDYPYIAWVATNVPDNAQVRLMWRNDYAPTRLNSIPLVVASGRLLPVSAIKDVNWSGTITGLALAIQGPVVHPVRIERVAAQPMGVVEVLRQRLAEWLTFEGWTQSSINTVTGGADVQALPLAVLIIGAAALATLAWLAIAYRRRAWALPIFVATLAITGWLLGDVRFGLSLVRQARATVAQFGGKDDVARHAAAEDGALFTFIEHVRAKLPQNPVRVFMAADDPYFRGRGAYHLYPNNVYFDPFENNIPAPGWMRPGDYIVVYRRRGVQFDPASGRLRWDNQEPVHAELLLAESGGALFKLL